MASVSGIGSTVSQLYLNSTLASSSSRTALKSGVQASISSSLSTLVENGTITEDQQKEITSAFARALQPSPPPPKGERMENAAAGELKKLVEEGSLGEEAADAAGAALNDIFSEELEPEEQKAAIEAALSKFVEQGALTEAQKRKLTAAMEEAAPPPRRGVPPEMKDSLDALVADGILTKEQHESILTILEEAQKNGTRPSLAALVENGTLTEEEKPEVESAFQNAHTLMQAKNAYGSSMSAFSDPLEALVADGVITEEIKAAVYGALSYFQTGASQFNGSM